MKIEQRYLDVIVFCRVPVVTSSIRLVANFALHGNSIPTPQTMTEPPTKKPKQQHFVPNAQAITPEMQSTRKRFHHPYCFPGKPTARSGNWKSALQVYLDVEDCASLSATLQANIYYHDDDCVVIYDGYPKARMHLLLLPRRLSSLSSPDSQATNIKGSTCGIRSIADLRKDLHYEELRKCHATARKLVKHLTEEYESLYRRDTTTTTTTTNSDKCLVRMGYHSVPSLDNLHLHIISTDLDSLYLKNKKHYNSFATNFFVDANEVENQLLRNGAVATIDVPGEEAKLQQALRCFQCGAIQKNMPILKQHLLNCSHPHVTPQT